MSRIFRKWSRHVLPALLLSSAIVVVFLSWILSKYPWTALSSEFGSDRPMRFFSPWPLNPLQRELHDKKKKRLPKAEQERVFALDMRRMEYINIPIFDVFMSDKAKHSGGDPLFRALGFGEFPWPWLETRRVLGDGTGPQRISYVPVPTPFGVSMQEGVLLAPGEDLDFPVPISKLRRTFRFFVLPLNAGLLRVSLGQYAWARTFTEADVNRPQFISVPVNDVAAMVAKVSAASFRGFLLQAHVAQSEMSGRLPIQVAEESQNWSLNPKYFKMLEAEPSVDVSDDGAEENPESAVRAEDSDTPQTPQPQPFSPTPAPTSAPETAPSSVAAQDSSKETALDSLLVTANPQVSVPGPGTVALGYNLMVVQVNGLAPRILSDEKRMAKIVPNIAELMSSSVRFDLPQEADAARTFRTFVMGESLPRFQSETQVLLRDAVERLDGVNLYRHLRDFGYQVFTVAPAPVLGFSKGFAWTSDGSLFSDRTLDANDWDFTRRRLKIDRDAQPVTGLEAVFQTKDVALPPPLVTSDYAAIGKYFDRVSGDLETFPDWRANEIFLPDDRDYYAATAVDQVQHWTLQNRQVRLLGHVWLGNSTADQRPSLKDFWRGLSVAGLSSFSDEVSHGPLAYSVLVDRAFGQIRDAVKARRLTHRTIWVVLVSQGDAVQAFVEVPGVLPKKARSSQQISMNDLRATLLSYVGVPQDSLSAVGGGKIPGKSVEAVSNVASGEVPVATWAGDAAQYSRLERFVLRMAPGKSRCAPFVWRSVTPIVHISASHPAYELDASRREIRVYPCSVPSSWVSVDWFQHVTTAPALPGETRKESFLRRVGGEFVFASETESERPLFYFGESMRNVSSPIFSMTNVSDAALKALFMRPWSMVGGELVSTMQRLEVAKRSLFPVSARDSTLVFFARENPVSEIKNQK